MLLVGMTDRGEVDYLEVAIVGFAVFFVFVFSEGVVVQVCSSGLCEKTY